MQDLSFSNGFKPQGCGYSIDTAAITAAAGVQMLEIDYEASLRNLSIVSGGAGTVGLGGYLTGGGHGALSLTYGLAADQVLEIEMVTPGGEILTVNECQHKDLFWAMRGVSVCKCSTTCQIITANVKQGGGSTFGVITSVTFKAFPSTPYATVLAILATVPGTQAFWVATANVLSQFPTLNDQGISGYSVIVPNFTSPALNITSPVAAYYGIFNLPLLYPGNSSASLTTALSNVFATATAVYPFQFLKSVTPTLYPDFYSWYAINNGPLNAGGDHLVGSRLLDEEALTSNLTALIEAFQTATPPGSGSSVYLVGGKGVWDVVPRGGSDAVNPAWRRALVHSGAFLLLSSYF
jgi:FAD binding domain